MHEDAATVIALQALGWLAADDELFPVFLGATGAGAGDLRARYLARLAERKAELDRTARALGWHVTCHHTDAPALIPLLWAHQALGVRL